MNRTEIEAWLRETDAGRLEELRRQADAVRREKVGEEVHLRGLIEISNHCVRGCAYCGLNAGNTALERYRMSGEEVLECARQAVAFGYGTVVIQSGEDYGTGGEWLAGVIRAIKGETPLAVTLSLGERSEEDLVLWREAGADRYLLRFETSNRQLYELIHPSLAGGASDRVAMLRRLRGMGYEIGSGVMVGIPGQTYGDLAGDIELFGELELDMIGVGPYIVHPDTRLGRGTAAGRVAEQAPSDAQMTYKVIALARLVCPGANIPSTTALATVNREDGREQGLRYGANVVMPNLTPVEYRALYAIYPAKACITETAEACQGCLRARIEGLGRRVGVGRGDSVSWRRRRERSVSELRAGEQR